MRALKQISKLGPPLGIKLLRPLATQQYYPLYLWGLALRPRALGFFLRFLRRGGGGSAEPRLIMIYPLRGRALVAVRYNNLAGGFHAENHMILNAAH